MIRIILTICLFVIGANVYSQAPLIIRNDGKTTALDSNLFVGKSFRPPAFADTTQANQSIKVLDSSGRIIFTRDSSTLWVRDLGNYWKKIVSGSGVTTLQQAFNADPTANPDINAGSNTFLIAGDNNSGGVSRLIVGNNQGAQLYSKLDNISYLNAVADGTIEIKSEYQGTNSQKLIMNESKSYFVSGGNTGSDTSLTKLGVGTTYPEAILDVSGAPRFKTDSAQVGYIWTSTDDKGLGQWRAAPAGADSSTYFTTFRADTMRENIYNSIENAPVPTLQQAYDAAPNTFPQITGTSVGGTNPFSINIYNPGNTTTNLFLDDKHGSIHSNDMFASISGFFTGYPGSGGGFQPRVLNRIYDLVSSGYRESDYQFRDSNFTINSYQGARQIYSKIGLNSNNPSATLHIVNNDSNAIKIQAPLGNSLVAGDSSLVIGVNGLIKKSAKPVSADSSIYFTTFRADTMRNNIYSNMVTTGSDASLKSLTITGTNGAGHIHLRHQASLPTATGQSTVIYANSAGNFAWKNDGNYHTTLATNANTADRTYTFQNKSYTVADSADVALKANTAGPTFTDSLTINSTTGAFTLPRMTQTQMNAITPRVGAQVYNTTYDANCSYTNDFGWWSNDPMWLTSNGFTAMEEFLTYAGTNGANGNLFQISIANGAVTNTTPISNRPGVLQLSTSTNAAGRATAILDNNSAASFIVGGGKLIYETDVQIPTLSSSTETYRFFTGFSSSNANVGTNGISFLYDSSGSSTGSSAIGRWQVVCANGSSRSYTTTDSTVTAGRWYRLRAEVNAAGNSVGFYINGTLVKTETNNIPTGALTYVSSIVKTNGTTARTAWVDFIRLRQKYTTPR